MSAISLRLPEELEAQLTREAKAQGCPKSEVARRALKEWLMAQEKKRMLNQMVTEAKTLYADPASRMQAHEIAEEGVNDWLEAIERDERAGGIDPE